MFARIACFVLSLFLTTCLIKTQFTKKFRYGEYVAINKVNIFYFIYIFYILEKEKK